MIPMVFIGITMYYLGILQGWLLFWYIVSIVWLVIYKFFKLGCFADYWNNVRGK